MPNYHEEEIMNLLCSDDSNYGSNNNIVREVIILKKIRDLMAITHPNIVTLKEYWF